MMRAAYWESIIMILRWFERFWSLMTQHLTNFYRIVESQEFDSSIIYLSAKSLMPSINRLVESTKQLFNQQLFSDQFIAEWTKMD